ncbi:type II secretion system protein J [Prosthecobacter sp.]|uniref:type II secretion system protein J n=1 Tax=Prosthecobacter sp. TaxID=1965333 RepID=UPI003784D582
MTCFRHRVRWQAPAFTLLEVLLAVFVFSMAAVALVEAVQQVGNTTVLQRREAMVQDRMSSLLVEYSRLLWKQPAPASATSEKVLEEDGVTYTLQVAPLELKNKDGQPLPEMVQVAIVATWKEGAAKQEATASTWVFRPLFRPVQ